MSEMWWFFFIPIPRFRVRYVPAGPRPPRPYCYRPHLKLLGVLAYITACVDGMFTARMAAEGPEWAAWVLGGVCLALAISGVMLVEKSKLPPLSWFYDDDDPEPDDNDPDDPEPWAGAGRMTA